MLGARARACRQRAHACDRGGGAHGASTGHGTHAPTVRVRARTESPTARHDTRAVPRLSVPASCAVRPGSTAEHEPRALRHGMRRAWARDGADRTREPARPARVKEAGGGGGGDTCARARALAPRTAMTRARARPPKPCARADVFGRACLATRGRHARGRPREQRIPAAPPSGASERRGRALVRGVRDIRAPVAVSARRSLVSDDDREVPPADRARRAQRARRFPAVHSEAAAGPGGPLVSDDGRE